MSVFYELIITDYYRLIITDSEKIRFLLIILFAKNNFIESVNYFAVTGNRLVATEKCIIIY